MFFEGSSRNITTTLKCCMWEPPLAIEQEILMKQEIAMQRLLPRSRQFPVSHHTKYLPHRPQPGYYSKPVAVPAAAAAKPKPEPVA